MNASLTSTDTLNWSSRSRCGLDPFGSRLALMNDGDLSLVVPLNAVVVSNWSSFHRSGWSSRSVPIMAPRRVPAEVTVPHIAFIWSMNGITPDDTDPVRLTMAPLGRTVDQSVPTPPPCCIVNAASDVARWMPGIESCTISLTKQLVSVTARSRPAPALIRPAGIKNPFSTARSALAVSSELGSSA